VPHPPSKNDTALSDAERRELETRAALKRLTDELPDVIRTRRGESFSKSDLKAVLDALLRSTDWSTGEIAIDFDDELRPFPKRRRQP
jgi:hypothetical protein